MSRWVRRHDDDFFPDAARKTIGRLALLRRLGDVRVPVARDERHDLWEGDGIGEFTTSRGPRLGLIRRSGQFDYAACLSVNCLSNSAGLTIPMAE